MDYEYLTISMDKKPPQKKWFFVIGILLVVVLGISSIYAMRAPASFEPGSIVTIPPGVSTKTTAEILAARHIIRSPGLFQVFVGLSMNNKVIAGDFQFDKRVSLIKVFRMVTQGDFGGTQVKITIPEGSSYREIADIVSQNIPGWNRDEFLVKAKNKEGYLFPDTYIVFRSLSVDAFIERLSDEYVKKITPLESVIAASGKSREDIIIMASLLEKEAKNAQEAQVISGILWKRIRIGMPLQVDASFLYTLGKTSAQLTLADLQKDGPYNTYTRKGLPVGPIGNPGIAMIEAALNPQPSPYLYYLHDNQGKIRYATTYQEHLENKRKYLD